MNRKRAGDLIRKGRRHVVEDLLRMARDAARAVRTDGMPIRDAEKVFNLETMALARRFKAPRLYDVIARGMELEDIDQLVADPGAVAAACADIEALATGGLHELSRRTPAR